MNKTKIITLFLVISFFISYFGVLTINAEDTSFEEKYAELFEERTKRREENDPVENWHIYYFMETRLKVLLYTDIAKNWNFRKKTIDVMNSFVNQWGIGFLFGKDYFLIECTEIDEAMKVCNFDLRDDGPCALREIVRYFNIPKEALIAANKKMVEEPDSIRSLFPMLTDQEFKRAQMDYHPPLRDFMIEAIYLEDDCAANTLLLKEKGSIYSEAGCVVTAAGLNNDSYDCMTVEEFAEYDLKPIWIEYFLNDPEVEEIIGTEKLSFLKTEREYQLNNPNIQKNGPNFKFPNF